MGKKYGQARHTHTHTDMFLLKEKVWTSKNWQERIIHSYLPQFYNLTVNILRLFGYFMMLYKLLRLSNDLLDMAGGFCRNTQ
jgi:hypothetical protein